MTTPAVQLTLYSHGAGCGCKIAPGVLDDILRKAGTADADPRLLVGNADRDDAAVMDLGDGTAIVSTTDFFMPVVDDARDFGRITAANAISDVYAMGGTPLMAVAILGWPINMLSPELAAEVILGAQEICREAGIPLAGGHSIDAPEPLFGLAVTGRVAIGHIRKNGGARPGDLILLTKPIGLGILTTAQKMMRLREEDARRAVAVMTALNKPGEALGRIDGVHAMTDVTGFGLAGHLLEMCKASGIGAEIHFNKIPLISDNLQDYIANQCSPAGAERTYQNLKDQLVLADPAQRIILCDPQTSGGLLIAVAPESLAEVQELLHAGHWHAEPIGRMTDDRGTLIHVLA